MRSDRNHGKFLPGHPGAKPKGAVAKTTKAIREFAQSVLEDEQYRKNLRARASAGELGALEVTLYHYAYGKPKETMDVTVEHTIYTVELD